jgi:ABC-type multidrug transport system fused ATPase/permease subunit
MEIPKSRLLKFKEHVQESLSYVEKELDSIKSPYFLQLIPLIATIGISVWQEIALYWLPASIIIMLIWIFVGIYNIINRSKKVGKNKKVFSKEMQEYSIKLQIVNMSGFFVAISIIYFLSLIILFLVYQGVIANDLGNPFFIWSFIFLIVYIITPFSTRGLESKLSDFKKITKNVLEQKKRYPVLFRLKVLLMILFVLAIVVSPFFAMFETFSLIERIPLLALIVILQFLSIVSLASYYSSKNARKELTNTLSNYISIIQLINSYLSGKAEIDKEKYLDLVNFYYNAKPFNLKIADVFSIEHMYWLDKNPSYILYLDWIQKKGKLRMTSN